MNKKKTKVEKYKPKERGRFTLDDVVRILDETIDEFATGSEMSFHMILVKRGLYRQLLFYWEKEFPDEVAPLVGVLRDIQATKYESALLTGVVPNSKATMVNEMGSPVNMTGLVWYGKTALGLITETDRQRIEIEKAKAEEQGGLEDDAIFEVEFTEVEEVEDND